MLLPTSAAASSSLGSSFLPRNGLVADRNGLSLRRIYDLSHQTGDHSVRLTSCAVPSADQSYNFDISLCPWIFLEGVKVHVFLNTAAVLSALAFLLFFFFLRRIPPCLQPMCVARKGELILPSPCAAMRTPSLRQWTWRLRSEWHSMRNTQEKWNGARWNGKRLCSKPKTVPAVHEPACQHTARLFPFIR